MVRSDSTESVGFVRDGGLVFGFLDEVKKELHNVALDETEFEGQYDGFEMLAIHHFIENYLLGKLEGLNKTP